MKRKVFVPFMVAGLSFLTVSPNALGAVDSNRESRLYVPDEIDVESTGDIVPQAAASGTIATVTLPAPSSSFDITLTVTNTTGGSSFGNQFIRSLILDCHEALGGKALTIDSVFGVVVPAGGTATVTTGNDADDIGPAVLKFTSFGNGEFTRFSTDPDTYESSSFGALRSDMAGCSVEVVYTSLLRGKGTLVLLPNGTMKATILPSSPGF